MVARHVAALRHVAADLQVGSPRYAHRDVAADLQVGSPRYAHRDVAADLQVGSRRQASIAVIGAGLAGLAAAVDLAGAGFHVEIFERSRLVGGRATSFEIDGIEVDNGQHVFLGCCTEFLNFVQRAGMSHAIFMQDRFEALVLSKDGSSSRLRAASLPAPWHLLGSFVGYRYLDWPSKIGIARALRAAKSARHAGGSFAQWLARQRQSEGAIRAFWRPFFVPALNAPLEEVSAADAAFVLSTAFLEGRHGARFGYATVPLARIARSAAERAAALHLSSPVSGLWFSPAGDELHGIELGDGTKRRFDAVVAAVPPPALSRLLGERCAGLPSLDAFAPYPIVDAHLWHDRGSLGFAFAALLDSPVQWIFEKAPGYLCCSMSAAQAGVQVAAAQLAAQCWSELSQAIPALRGGALLRSAVTRNPEATYLPRSGQARPPAATALANFTLAGSWCDTGWPDTMESAVRSGRAAAKVLRGALGGVAVA
jgi:squalene-associated FAD-dependent desaturase